MTETHKAAVEALEEALAIIKTYRELMPERRQDEEFNRKAEFALNSLRTLKQPSSVEVTELTVDSANALCAYWPKDLQSGFLAAVALFSSKYPQGIRITRAAATDGVKS